MTSMIQSKGLGVAVGYANGAIREEGGNNRGDEVEFFQSLMGGKPGDSWCADFVCTCLVKAYCQLRGLDASRDGMRKALAATESAFMPLSGSCATLGRTARDRAFLKPPSWDPFPGDIVLFDFDDVGVPHHTGFYMRNAGVPAHMQTIEGNTSGPPGSSNADVDGVFRKVRPVAKVWGYIHVP